MSETTNEKNIKQLIERSIESGVSDVTLDELFDELKQMVSEAYK